MLSIILNLSLVLSLLPSILAHGGGHHSQAPIPDDPNDWATRHMAGKNLPSFSECRQLNLMIETEEHHIGNFDAGAFFQLHDFDESGGWTPDEVRRFYGLNDESNANVSADKREEVTRVVFRDFDRDHNGIVERSEWIEAIASGSRLPDFGVSAYHQKSAISETSWPSDGNWPSEGEEMRNNLRITRE